MQVGGSALRIGVDDLRQAMAELPELRALLLDDLHTTLLRSSQSTACSLSHSFRQRFARWLLTAQDRSSLDEFRITQDLLARILGVRRATVSETIKSLEGRGILARMRGLIKFATGIDWRRFPAAAIGALALRRRLTRREFGPHCFLCAAVANRRPT